MRCSRPTTLKASDGQQLPHDSRRKRCRRSAYRTPAIQSGALRQRQCSPAPKEATMPAKGITCATGITDRPIFAQELAGCPHMA